MSISPAEGIFDRFTIYLKIIDFAEGDLSVKNLCCVNRKKL